MSAALVQLVPRPSKTAELFESVQAEIHRHTDANDSTCERLMRRIALAREFVRLKADVALDDSRPGDSDALFGLLELLEQISEGVGHIECAFTTISNQIFNVQRPELAAYFDDKENDSEKGR